MYAPEFDIVIEGGHTWARVAVFGELDLATAGELGAALDRERIGGRSVLLDLSGVEFLDSTGLTIILRTMQAAQVDAWNFGILADLSPAALRTIRIAGVLPMLPLVEEDP